MKIDDFWVWEFNPGLEEYSEIECPECKKWSLYNEWKKEVEVYCGYGGEHSAIMCPKCEELFDHVWCDTFKTRKQK